MGAKYVLKVAIRVNTGAQKHIFGLGEHHTNSLNPA
jgi:hypothetical protein